MVFNGKKLKQILEDRKVTQRDLAIKINVNEVSISRYISGERSPKWSVIEDMAEVLNVDTRDLMDTEVNVALSKFTTEQLIKEIMTRVMNS